LSVDDYFYSLVIFAFKSDIFFKCWYSLGPLPDTYLCVGIVSFLPFFADFGGLVYYNPSVLVLSY